MTNFELHTQLLARLTDLMNERSKAKTIVDKLLIYGRIQEVAEQLKAVIASTFKKPAPTVTVDDERAFASAIKFRDKMDGRLVKDIADAFDATVTTIQQRTIFFDALQSKRITMAGKLILRDVLKQFKNCDLLAEIEKNEKLADEKVRSYLPRLSNGKYNYETYKRLDTIHTRLRFVRLILTGSREIPFFHGGCHYCTVPYNHGVAKCPSCQYFLANWDLPDLNPTHDKD